MNLSLDQSEGSVLSDDVLDTPDDLDINVDDIETPDETDSLEFINNGNDLEWEGQTFELCFSFFYSLLISLLSGYKSPSHVDMRTIIWGSFLQHSEISQAGRTPHPFDCVLVCSDDTPVATAKRLPGEGEEERDSSGRLWRTVIIGDQEQRIDMQVIRPYLRVVTHGGESLGMFKTKNTT